MTKTRAEPPGPHCGGPAGHLQPGCLARVGDGRRGVLSTALLQTHCTEVQQPNYLIVCTQHWLQEKLSWASARSFWKNPILVPQNNSPFQLEKQHEQFLRSGFGAELRGRKKSPPQSPTNAIFLFWVTTVIPCQVFSSHIERSHSVQTLPSQNNSLATLSGSKAGEEWSKECTRRMERKKRHRVGRGMS